MTTAGQSRNWTTRYDERQRQAQAVEPLEIGSPPVAVAPEWPPVRLSRTPCRQNRTGNDCRTGFSPSRTYDDGVLEATEVSDDRVQAPASLEAEVADLRRKVETLKVGMLSSRLIGTAIGLVMADHQVSRAAAFDLLRARSQNTNTRLAVVAAEVVDLAETRATR